MLEEYSPLRPKKERAAQLLAAGQSKSAVARELDVSRVTVQRWATEPEVKARVNQIVAPAAEEAIRILEESVVDNLAIILDIAKNGGRPGIVGSQLKAAQWAVEQVLRGVNTQGKEDFLSDELNTLSDRDLDELVFGGETGATLEPSAASTDELSRVLPFRSQD